AGEGGSSLFSDPQHSRKLLKNLRSFREDPIFCDSALVVDGAEIPVQRNLLAAVSPYIRTKFNYSPPKNNGTVFKITLEGVGLSVIHEILEYIYTGEVGDGARMLARNAPLIRTTCVAEKFLSMNDKGQLLRCCNSVLQLIKTSLQSSILSSLSSPFTPLSICDPRPPAWQVHMKEVMAAVWLDTLDPHFLQEQMLREPLVRVIIQECAIPLTETRSGEALLSSFRPRGYSECIVTVGGEERSSRKPTAAVRCMCPLYDPNRQLWIDLAPMGTARVNHGVVSAEGSIFAIGGSDGDSSVLSSGEKYNPDNNSWTAIAPMREARMNFGIVHIDGILYVIGGEDETSELLSGETYDIYTDTWSLLPDITILRKIGCYAVMRKKIYAMGGGSYGKLFESAECYDPKTQQWTAICPLKERRFGAVACGVGQELYVFGGVRRKEGENVPEGQMVTCKSEMYHDQVKRYIYFPTSPLCPRSPLPRARVAQVDLPDGPDAECAVDLVGDLDTGTQYDFVREYRRNTGTWHHTKPLLPSDLRRTGCAALRIANCRLFKLQMEQGLFRIRVP
uniref:Gigaxonin n=1 Tax=Petromyzon marinus TaxID=7757 RepID=S4RQ10_PETMA